MIQFPSIPMTKLLDGILISYIHLYLKFRFKRKKKEKRWDYAIKMLVFWKDCQKHCLIVTLITRTEGKLRVDVK